MRGNRKMGGSIQLQQLGQNDPRRSSTNTDDLSGKFMTRNERKCGEELPFVDVEIGSTDTTGAYTNEHFISRYLRCWHLSIAQLLGGIIDDCFHRTSPNSTG